MKIKNKLNIIIFACLLILGGKNIFAQNEQWQINGATLEGKEIDGVKIREVSGNVIITQGKIKITCDRAVEYIDAGKAELMGHVVAVQDTIKIKTSHGFYYKQTKIATSDAGIELNDSHYTLRAKKGTYYFNEKKADFSDDVLLFDKISNVNANHLVYYREENKAVATGNVSICDTSSVVFTDSLIAFREKKLSYGFGHVEMYDPQNKTVVLSGKFENDDSKLYSKIFDHPLLAEVDSTSDGKMDTLYVISKTMEAYRDTTKRYIVTDSVKMFRNFFSAVNNLTYLYRKENRIFTYKLESDLKPPVLWYENSQLIGDSINIHIDKRKLKQVEINQNAFTLSLHKGYEFRYDQMSGKIIKIYFDQGEISRVNVNGNFLSIYYSFDEKEEPNGLVKSSSERGNIFFKDRKVEDIKLYGSVSSDYHPENLVEGKEKDFTLPSFVLYKNRPRKEEFLTKEMKAALTKLQEITLNNNGKYPNLKKRKS